MTETVLLQNSTPNAIIVPSSQINGLDKSKEAIKDDQDHIPPDGGSRAWIVMVSAFLCNGILFGIINTYSVVYMSLQRQLKEKGDEGASSKAGKFIQFYTILSNITFLRYLTKN